MTRRHVRAGAVAGGALVLAAAAAGVVVPPAGAADASETTKTVEDGPFKGLSVTVAKTANLVNEVVEITWEGGRPTEPIGAFQRHYMQIMQCWGDDPGGPRPEQCQWGAAALFEGTPGTGVAVTTRQVTSTSLPVDPEETHVPVAGEDAAFVPFDAVDGRKLGGRFNDFSSLFDAQGSNERPAATTRGDGTGQEFVEIHTGAQAPGLGCGRLVSPPEASPVGRACWLVLVPRSDVEVDGSIRTPGEEDPQRQRLQTSPLSASNWKHRVVFPLTFQPIGGSCPVDSDLITILGQENATEAITRWQQSLCDATDSVFSFNQVPDDAARANLAGLRPGMAIVSRPLDATPPKGEVVYAPLAVSGLGFAYNLETQILPDDPPEIRQRAGQRIGDLKLNARLVAKLLTQSYVGGVTVSEPIEQNPLRIEDDPEFLALNPSMAGINRFAANSLWTVVTPLNPADATAQVWEWISGDAAARDFMAGNPDPSGMIVNPAFKDADLVRTDFPKLDQGCRPEIPLVAEPLCVPDAFPYANDMHEAVRGANRGDNLARNSWDNLAIPPSYKKPSSGQSKGLRAIMVVSDTATAARYHLPMARLENRAGNFVAPDPANLLAGVDAMKPAEGSGVLVPDPNTDAPDAYPLTVLSYAATVPAALSPEIRSAYAGLISYANGDGQKPGVGSGSLPDGYAPMPESLTAQGRAAAERIRAFVAPTPTPGPQASPSPTPQATQQPQQTSTNTVGSASGSGSTSGGGSSSNSTGTNSTGTGSSGTGTTGGSGSQGSSQPTPSPTPPAESPSPGPAPAPAPASVPATITRAAVAALTPPLPIGKARYALLWIVLAGTVALAAAQAAPRLPVPQGGARGEPAAGRPPHRFHAEGRGMPDERGR